MIKFFKKLVMAYLLFLVFAFFSGLFRATTDPVGELNKITFILTSFVNAICIGWASVIFAMSNIFLFKKTNLSPNDFVEGVGTSLEISLQLYPFIGASASMLGAFFSIGGVIAVWLAKNADDAKHAFKLGFYAEVGEFVVHQFGNKVTFGKFHLTKDEIIASLIVAIIMGFFAVQNYKAHN